MDDKQTKNLELIREKYEARVNGNTDGGDGSGNWGHLGRPGEWGGSQPGGGGGFRLFDKGSSHATWGGSGLSHYTSQAKVRRDMLKTISDAKNPLEKKLASAASKRVNMNQKSAKQSNMGKKGFDVVPTAKINPTASKDILGNKKAGKKVHSPVNKKVSGTHEAIKRTYYKNTVNGKKK